MGEETQSGKNWSKVAATYAKMVDETDLASAAGAACNEILAVADQRFPFDQASFILDIGCGQGAVISRLFDSEEHVSQIPSSARLVAADISQSFVDTVLKRKDDRGGKNQIWNRLEVHRWDATDLREDVQDEEVSHLLSSYVYFAMMNEKKGLAEALRVLKSGGLFIETSMGYTDWGHLPTFVKEVRPDKTVPELGKQWQSAAATIKMLSEVGFRDVDAKEFDIGIALDKAEDAVNFVLEVFPYVKPLMEDMSEEEKRKTKELMLHYVKSLHPREPLVLKGTGVIGWGTK